MNPPVALVRSRDQAGIALVLVLWVLVLLSAMAVSLALTQRLELAMTANVKEEREARALVAAGIEFMTLQLLLQRGQPESEDWPADGLVRPWAFEGHPIGVAATPETARIDLNMATPEMLESLLRSVGLEDADVQRLRDVIVDWRDGDDQHLLNGAEDPEYDSAGLPYGAKDANFESVEELRQLLGMTPEAYARISPALTVHSARRTVNPLFAAPAVLAALPGMTPEELQAYLQLRDMNRQQRLPVPPPAGVNPMYLEQGQIPIYRVYAEAAVSGGGMVRGEAVVNLGASERRGYQVLERSNAPAVVPQAAPVEQDREGKG
jgi:general secretion pathway protein K